MQNFELVSQDTTDNNHRENKQATKRPDNGQKTQELKSPSMERPNESFQQFFDKTNFGTVKPKKKKFNREEYLWYLNNRNRQKIYI